MQQAFFPPRVNFLLPLSFTEGIPDMGNYSQLTQPVSVLVCLVIATERVTAVILAAAVE